VNKTARAAGRWLTLAAGVAVLCGLVVWQPWVFSWVVILLIDRRVRENIGDCLAWAKTGEWYWTND
jgi:hypothetical protein